MTTLAAGHVTATWVLELANLCHGKNATKSLEKLLELAPHFDCRMASYDSFEEARALLLWRAYDCSVNGISDAVYHSEGFSGKKELMTKGMGEKLKWLKDAKRLPLRPHQAFGTYFTRVKFLKEGWNPVKKENVTSWRSRIDRMEGTPLLKLAKADSLL